MGTKEIRGMGRKKGIEIQKGLKGTREPKS